MSLNVSGTLTNIILSERSHIKEYMLHNSIYIMSKADKTYLW